MKKLMLLDGFSLINRAYHALPLLTNGSGEYTNAIYGFLNIFLRFLNEETPDCAAVCFDSKAPTFRHEMYKEYKGTRKKMPAELLSQIPAVKSLLEKMGVKTLAVPGLEADDIMGAAAKKAEKDGYSVTIVSGDRDLLQIASDNITIRIPKTKGGKTEVETYTKETVIEVFGVTPSQITDVKALMGDSSDNIPGVPSVGEKTAYKLIREYGSLDNVIKNVCNITPQRIADNIEKYKDTAILSRKLAEIDITASIDSDYNSMSLSEDKIFGEEAGDEIHRLEFKTLYRFFKTSHAKNEKPGIDIKEPPLTILKEMSNTEKTACVIFAENDNLLGTALCHSSEKVFVFLPQNQTASEFIEAFRPFFESSAPKISLDIKSDIHYLNKFGITPKNFVFDIKLASYVLDSGKKDYSFSASAKDFLNEDHPPRPEPENISEFLGNTAAAAFRLYSVMENKLKENAQNDLYRNIELPLAYVLADMEKQGICVDKAALLSYGEALSNSITELTKKIYALAQEEFNINSPKQMAQILFGKLGLKGGKKTKTGWSTAADVLEKLKDNEIVALILEYRTLTKLKSTYVDGLLSVYDEKTGKIYTTFDQTATSTGRISSHNPNLQNIPVKTPLGRELRKVFTAPPGEIFIDADYSQIELRVLAHMSDDDTFINAFKNNEDIHKITASQVFETPFEDVTPEQRQNAKAVNFGIVYGISAFALSQDLKISVPQAQEYIDGYFKKYEKVKAFLDKTIADAKKTGYAETEFGRRRIIPEIKSDNFAVRSFGERAAMNAPIQGTAADIIKIAMIKIYKGFENENMKSKIILQIHDELLISAPENEKEKAIEIIKYEMENAALFKAPLKADVNTGKSRYDTK